MPLLKLGYAVTRRLLALASQCLVLPRIQRVAIPISGKSNRATNRRAGTNSSRVDSIRRRSFYHFASFALSVGMLMSTSSASPANAAVTKETLKLAGNGVDVPTYRWSEADVAPRAVLVALHGGVQHGNNFNAFAQQLAPQGVVTYAIDFRGHGEWLVSSQKRPPVDYPGTVADVIQLTSQIRSTHPQLPVFCVGESLGAAVGISAMSQNPKLFDGLILVSCGIKPNAGQHLSAIFNSIGQGLKTLGSTIDVSPHITGISEDPRGTEEMLNDPLGRRKSSVWSLLATVQFLHNAHRLAPKLDQQIPILVLAGGQDQIMKPDSTQAVFDRLAVKDKSFKKFPNLGHLLVTSAFVKPEVVSVVEEWMSAHTRGDNTVAVITESATAVPNP